MNAVANFCFLAKGSNIQIGDSDPTVYFHSVEEMQPALASQWIPMDEDLWQVSRSRTSWQRVANCSLPRPMAS